MKATMTGWIQSLWTHRRTTVAYVLIVAASVYGLARETATVNEAKHTAMNARSAAAAAQGANDRVAADEQQHSVELHARCIEAQKTWNALKAFFAPPVYPPTSDPDVVALEHALDLTWAQRFSSLERQVGGPPPSCP